MTAQNWSTGRRPPPAGGGMVLHLIQTAVQTIKLVHLHMVTFSNEAMGAGILIVADQSPEWGMTLPFCLNISLSGST